MLLSNHDHHCTVILVPDSWTGLAKSLETELENILTDVALQNITTPLKFEELIPTWSLVVKSFKNKIIFEYYVWIHSATILIVSC